MRLGKMAPAGGCGAVRGLWVLLVLPALARVALALTEQYPTLSLLKQRQGPAGGCASAGEWAEQYSAESDSSFLHFHESDCDIGGSSSCESVLSLNTEKILSQAKLLAEQKRFPFATDNVNTNEELGAVEFILCANCSVFWDWNHKDDTKNCVVLEENEMRKIQELFNLSFTRPICFPFLAMLCICTN